MKRAIGCTGYIVLVYMFFISCDKDHLTDCLKSSGSIITEARPVSDFDRIDIYNNVDVILTQDAVNSITAEAGKHIISGITTEIHDGVLTIRNENKCNWVRSYSKSIVVHVHEKNVNTIHHHGSATVSSTNALQNSFLDLNVWSSGDMKLSVETDRIYSRQHSTVGDMTLSGNSTYCYVYNAGNAFTYEKDLAVQNAEIDQRGTGDIFVHVSQSLDVSIHDSGNIYYSGNPQVSSSISGSGQLIHQ